MTYELTPAKAKKKSSDQRADELVDQNNFISSDMNCGHPEVPKGKLSLFSNEWL